MAGIDECACCANSPKARDEETGVCPTCSSVELNCIDTCERAGDYGQCDNLNPVVRECVQAEEMGECLPATKGGLGHLAFEITIAVVAIVALITAGVLCRRNQRNRAVTLTAVSAPTGTAQKTGEEP